MAFINKETVKEIRAKIKERFPAKDGWKFSVRGGNSGELTVAFVKGPVEFEAWEFDPYSADPEAPKCRQHAEARDSRKTLTEGDVNRHWFEEHLVDGPGKDAVRDLNKIIAGYHWDDSDSMTDYFNCAFYYNIRIGKDWETPYQKV